MVLVPRSSPTMAPRAGQCAAASTSGRMGAGMASHNTRLAARQSRMSSLSNAKPPRRPSRMMMPWAHRVQGIRIHCAVGAYVVARMHSSLFGWSDTVVLSWPGGRSPAEPVRADHVARPQNYRAFRDRVSHRAGADGRHDGCGAGDRGGAGRRARLAAMRHVDREKAREQVSIIRQQVYAPVNMNFFCHKPVELDPGARRHGGSAFPPTIKSWGSIPPRR